MKLPKNHVVIFQPKYRVPSVFDLHQRGTFSERPPVDVEWGFRVIADKACRCLIQTAVLAHQQGSDPDTGRFYNWVVKEERIVLDDTLIPDLKADDHKLSNPDMKSVLMTEFNQWRDNVVPLTDEGAADKGELKKKLSSLVEDAFERKQKELVRRNGDWVKATVPRYIQDFKKGLYYHVGDNLYQEYRRIGGEDTEDNLIKKIALFDRVFTNCGRNDLLKPDGSFWRNEDEALQCWFGFAGSEPEAHRVFSTIKIVFKGLEL